MQKRVPQRGPDPTRSVLQTSAGVHGLPHLNCEPRRDTQAEAGMSPGRLRLVAVDLAGQDGVDEHVQRFVTGQR